ncbi:MAG: hypothetical protein D0528_08395 [Methylococcales bacterium]|nr:MAG: hypothetical protein D0528_08395 [Methylococcales bacterium]
MTNFSKIYDQAPSGWGAYIRGHYAEAEPLSRRATLIFARSLGWQHPNTETVSSNWTAILSKLGKQPEVELKKLQAETQTAPNRQ